VLTWCSQQCCIVPSLCCISAVCRDNDTGLAACMQQGRRLGRRVIQSEHIGTLTNAQSAQPHVSTSRAACKQPGVCWPRTAFTQQD
jgi:hypothetical protein